MPRTTAGKPKVGNVTPSVVMTTEGDEPDQAQEQAPPVSQDSTLIGNLADAEAYYKAHLLGTRAVTVKQQSTTIEFEKQATHLFSEEVTKEEFDLLPASEKVFRRLKGGRSEYRRFNLERARLMSNILKIIEGYVFSIPGTASHGTEKRLLHSGLVDGIALRVVLRPKDMKTNTWTCISSYPVSKEVWLRSKAAKRVKFP